MLHKILEVLLKDC